MKERIVIFIDGRNFYHSIKGLSRRGLSVNFREIIKRLSENRDLICVFYYNALLDKDYDERGYKRHNRFLEVLRSIPKFKVVICDWRKIIDENGCLRYDVKGDDVRLAHDLLMGAFQNMYDVAVVVSGDADFIPVINTIRRKFGKRVGNGFFRRTSSYRLRKSCDFSINMNKLIYELNKKASAPSGDGTSQV